MSSAISVVPGTKESGMPYVRFGNTGMQVSRICLGCMSYGSPKWRDWVLDEPVSRPFFKKALECGINFFDTADVYSLGESERITGAALNDYARRDEVVLATKVFNPLGSPDAPNGKGLSRKHILQSADDSLKRLGTNFIDLYQIHRWDNETPIEETMCALNDLVRSGKVRYIGASSMYAWQFAKAQAVAAAKGYTQFVSMQGHYNLVYREEEREMIPLCRDQGVALIPWSPLARGFLIGNRKNGDNAKDAQTETSRAKSDAFAHQMYYQQPDFDIVDRVTEIAKKRNINNAQVATAWIMSKPGITAPIIGATKLSHIDDAVAAAKLTLTKEEIDALEAPYIPHKVLGH